MLVAAVYVDLMYEVSSTNHQQERRRKALVAIVLSMKEAEERNSRADEVAESQSFSKDDPSTSSSGDENFEQHLDQEAKRGKWKTKKRLINRPRCNSST